MFVCVCVYVCIFLHVCVCAYVHVHGHVFEVSQKFCGIASWSLFWHIVVSIWSLFCKKLVSIWSLIGTFPSGDQTCHHWDQKPPSGSIGITRTLKTSIFFYVSKNV